MNSSKKFSRRKFLSGVGVVAGAAAIMPAVNSINALGQRNTLSTSVKGSAKPSLQRHPAVAKLGTLKAVQILNRRPGTARLPLSKRPL